ncbi:GLPGLI family protein [Mesonia hippocampi]|uniref:GLPGLI family protein n=1 Tax=Mesonia hippocampi TaxID=1628250 RepID=A0A840EMZ4_9FLAO|nr:GLPGLI family protein [Mesonia hippocampi]MBB4118475.1 GLPGLI family protein [Mesonia hippocampi]
MNKIYIILISLLFYYYSDAQNISATYSISVVDKDQIAKQKHDDKFNKVYKILMERVGNISTQVSYQLKISGQQAVFSMNDFLVKDRKEQSSLNLLNTHSKGLFYNDITCPEQLQQTEVFGKMYIVDLPEPVWEIKNEESKIGNYTCKKALTKQVFYDKHGEEKSYEVVAWFTNELPFSFGPVGFAGLPGLIVKLEIEDRIFILQDIKKEKTSLSIKKPTKGKEISLKEYYELFSTAMGDFK